MPKKNIPPFVQVLRNKGRTRIRGYRGWATLAGRRKFGPLRQDAMKAHADAVVMRGMQEEPSFGGAFESRANDWLADVRKTRAADTVDFYDSKLKAIYLSIPKSVALARITPPVLREFVREAQERGLGARTIQHCRRTLNCFFVWCIRRGYAMQNPVGNIDWPKPAETMPDVFNEVELAGLLAKIADPWARDLATFMAFTGLRRAEMARLRNDAIDLRDHVLWVAGKTRAQAHPIPADATEAAARLARADAEFVVPGESEKGRREKVAETFRQWQDKLKEPRFHPHALRHSVATILLRKGVGAPTVQRFLRHSSYAMTQRYVHMVESDLRTATAQLRLVAPREAEKEHG